MTRIRTLVIELFVNQFQNNYVLGTVLKTSSRSCKLRVISSNLKFGGIGKCLGGVNKREA